MSDNRRDPFDRIVAVIRRGIEAIFPSANAVAAQSQSVALRQACCGLLMEVARLGSVDSLPKREAVARTLIEMFGMPSDETAGLMDSAGAEANRYTSYYEPVALINRLWSPSRKARFVEQLWRVAMADGRLDVYEEHLVRKLADLLYVPHTEFILAKHRAMNGSPLSRTPR